MLWGWNENVSNLQLTTTWERENLQVLEVAAGELVVGNDLNLALTLLGDLNLVAEVADATLNLDLVLEELLKGSDVEDLVGGGLGSVDDELLGNLLVLALAGALDRLEFGEHDVSLLFHAAAQFLSSHFQRGKKMGWANSKAVLSCTYCLRSHFGRM